MFRHLSLPKRWYVSIICIALRPKFHDVTLCYVTPFMCINASDVSVSANCRCKSSIWCFRWAGYGSRLSFGRWTSSRTRCWVTLPEGSGTLTHSGTNTSSTGTVPASTPSCTITRVAGGWGGLSTYRLTSFRKRSNSTSWGNTPSTNSGATSLKPHKSVCRYYSR